MARYPSGGQLPPIQWEDRVSPNQHHPGTGNRKNYFGSHGSLQFEDRGASLEQDLANTFTQAQAGGPSWQDKSSGAVFQGHIQTVALAIKKINKEIEIIEERLQKRQKASEHTDNSMKSLEIQHVGSIADLRQRVGRCDVSIAKLSGDTRRITESIAAFNKQILDYNAQQARVIGDLETKISRQETQLDKYITQQYSKVDSVETGSKHMVELLDTKLKNQLEEMQRALENLQMKSDSERHLLERGLTTLTESAISKTDSKQDRFEQNMMNRLEDIERKVSHLSGSIQNEQEKLHTVMDRKLKELEKTLKRDQEGFENEIRHELEEMAKDNEGGFKRVNESLGSMRIVLEGKQQLLADNLQKQVANAKKLVVLT